MNFYYSKLQMGLVMMVLVGLVFIGANLYAINQDLKHNRELYKVYDYSETAYELYQGTMAFDFRYKITTNGMVDLNEPTIYTSYQDFRDKRIKRNLDTYEHVVNVYHPRLQNVAVGIIWALLWAISLLAFRLMQVIKTESSHGA